MNADFDSGTPGRGIPVIAVPFDPADEHEAFLLE
jgi:hypothetical protein